MAVADHRAELDETECALLDVGLVIVGTSPPERDASALLMAASNMFDLHGLPLEAAVTRHYLGLQRWQEGECVAAKAALDDSSRRYSAIGHDWGVAAVEATLGAVRAAMGERVPALAAYRRSLEHSRRIDNRPQIAQALQGLGLLASLGGQVDEAVAALGEASDIALSNRSATSASYCLETLGAVAAATSDHHMATRALAAAMSARERLGVPVWTAASDVVKPVLDAARSSLDTDDYTTAWHDGEDADPFDLLRAGLSQIAQPAHDDPADGRRGSVAHAGPDSTVSAPNPT
jgi:tetratricopeptide (TPR) repeat protein